MVTIKSKGNFNKIKTFFKNSTTKNYDSIFHRYGKEGVTALASYTPKDSGNTANSWDYRIVKAKGSVTLEWFNTNSNRGVNIALLIQYGHLTKSGGFVSGYDYINPALEKVFDRLSAELQKEVSR